MFNFNNTSNERLFYVPVLYHHKQKVDYILDSFLTYSHDCCSICQIIVRASFCNKQWDAYYAGLVLSNPFNSQLQNIDKAASLLNLCQRFFNVIRIAKTMRRVSSSVTNCAKLVIYAYQTSDFPLREWFFE